MVAIQCSCSFECDVKHSLNIYIFCNFCDKDCQFLCCVTVFVVFSRVIHLHLNLYVLFVDFFRFWTDYFLLDVFVNYFYCASDDAVVLAL